MSPDPLKPAYVVRIVEDRWATARRVIESVAIVAAGSWAFYTFFYQEKIKPQFERAALSATLKMERVGTVAGAPAVRVTLRFHNDGATRTDVYAEAVNVFGANYDARPASSHTAAKGDYTDDATLRESRPRLLFANALLRAAAKRGNPRRHILLRPGQSAEDTRVIVIPRGYAVLEAEGHVIGGRPVEPGTYDITVRRDARGGLVFTSPVGGDDLADYLVL